MKILKIAGSILNPQTIKFALIGAANTIIDLTILNILFRVFTGANTLLLNSISISITMIFSFIMNSIFVFGDRSHIKLSNFIKFASITLLSTLLLQSVIIGICKSVFGLGQSAIRLSLFKLIATSASMVTNYLGYSGAVFKKKK
jgi:putative flippase GtrA